MNPTTKIFNEELRERPFIQKNCTLCGKEFETKTRSKNICSFECRREHVRQHSKFYSRTRRLGLSTRSKVMLACLFCGFDKTIDMHRELGEIYPLCPNHHCLITRNIETLESLAEEFNKMYTKEGMKVIFT